MQQQEDVTTDDRRQVSKWVARSRHARYRLALFQSIYEENEQHRSQAIDSIVQIVRTWITQISQVERQVKLDASDRPSSFPEERQVTRQSSSADEEFSIKETRELFYTNLLVILRMSCNCPFEDVRKRFTQLLMECRLSGIAIPRPSHNSPSFFIPKEKVIQIAGDDYDATTKHMMAKSFIANGRFSHVYRLMIYFPSYMQRHAQTFNQVMRYQGPLPRSWRNYIAIMAASQHSCQYLVSLQTSEFLQNGGDASWLQGLAWAPVKLRKLASLNTILAHQPWMLGKENIETLLKGSDNWSKSELVQAIVVFATFHSLSSFVMGCGVAQEIDMPGGTEAEMENILESLQSEPSSPDVDEELLNHSAQLVFRLKGLEVDVDGADQQEVFANCEEQETFRPESDHASSIHSSRHSRDDNLGGDVSAMSSNSALADETPINYIFEDLSRFLSDSELSHVDFDYKSQQYSIFRLQDYNWEEHACPSISKYLPETGDFIDREFNAILNLTDNSIFNSRQQAESPENVDTWPFRQAIWYYVLRLAGLSHDDYNYHEVNIYLNKRIKQYIKKVACYPEQIVPSDFHRMGFTFRPDEKCQINLLASEARKCSELVYALCALQKCER